MSAPSRAATRERIGAFDYLVAAAPLTLSLPEQIAAQLASAEGAIITLNELIGAAQVADASLTTSDLSATAGIVSGQIASLAASKVACPRERPSLPKWP